MMRRPVKPVLSLASLLLTVAVLTSCSLTDKIADGIIEGLHGFTETAEPEPSDPVDDPGSVPVPPEPSEISYTWKLTVVNDSDQAITNLFAEPAERYSVYGAYYEPAPRLSAPLAAGESVALDLTDCAEEKAGSPFELIIQTGDSIFSVNDYPLSPGDTVHLYRRSDEMCAQADAPEVDYAPILTLLDWRVIGSDQTCQMTDSMKADWNRLIDAVIAHQPTVTLSGTDDENYTLMNTLNEWRLRFLLDLGLLDYGTAEDGSKVLFFTYTYTAAEQEQMLNDLQYELTTVLNRIITRDMNTTEKVLAVYRWCAGRMEYDDAWVEELNASEDPYCYPDLDIMRGLSTGLGVCHTYSYLAEFLLRQLGIECLTLKSDMYDGTRHAWLCVRLDDGNFYHFDPTWEHTDGSGGLLYFGMTDEERDADGVIDYSWSYYWKYGPVTCGSEFFYSLRDVWAWGFGPGHTLRLYCSDIDGEVIYDTVTGERSVPMAEEYVIEPDEISENYPLEGSEDIWDSLTPEQEAEQRESLAGEWTMYSADAHADAAWLTLNADGSYSLKIDLNVGLWGWESYTDEMTEYTYRLLTTDAAGEIIDVSYLPSNVPPDSERTFEILEGYDEYQIELQSGMTAVFEDEVIEVYGSNAQLVSVGTDHGDSFTAEILYAVVEFDEVFRYDAAEDEWFWLDRGAKG